MKTIGERIQQARMEKQMSAWDLALAVGYKTQSGISNLENTATGTGGHKLKDIARVLHVSVDWLLTGPDCDKLPFSPQQIDTRNANPEAREIEEPRPLLYAVASTAVWPFDLFDYDGWMKLSAKDREEFENLIAGAVLRSQKMRSSI